MKRSFRFWKKPARQGFTLIELLVGIAIVAILITVSFPVYRSAIAHANISKCSSNLRQIGVAMFACAGDNNGQFPTSGAVIPYGSVDSTTGAAGWCEQLEPYLSPGAGKGGASTVFQCPDSCKIIANNKNYSYFNGAHAAYAEAHEFASVALPKMQAMSKHIIAGDIAFDLFADGLNDADKDDYMQDPAFNGNATIPIHLGSSNILFADGHVESLRKFDTTIMTTVYGGINTSYLSP